MLPDAGLGTVTAFRLIAESGACCRGTSSLQLGARAKSEGPPHPVALPDGCHARCLELRCSHFSHSTFYQACEFCRGCQLQKAFASKMYTSWRAVNESAANATRGPAYKAHKLGFSSLSHSLTIASWPAVNESSHLRHPHDFERNADGIRALLIRRQASQGCVVLPPFKDL